MKPILLCLHGWGGSKESFTELRAALQNDNITVLTPDLPGFGAEPDPPRAWSIDDYADWVTQWMQKNIAPDRNIYLLGHSHGGRIALTLASRLTKKPETRNQKPINHLFLCAPAGIRHPRHFKRIIGLTLAKSGKFFLSIPGLNRLEPLGKKLLYKLVRVHDYEKANPVMRETMIKVSAEDLRPMLKSINVPTDLFWGTEDGMTPIGDAYIMEKEIAGSRLHVYPGIRHGVHRDKAKEIAEVIREKILR